MDALIAALGRVPRQRSTVYGTIPETSHACALDPAPLTAPIQTPPRKRRPAQTLESHAHV